MSRWTFLVLTIAGSICLHVLPSAAGWPVAYAMNGLGAIAYSFYIKSIAPRKKRAIFLARLAAGVAFTLAIADVVLGISIFPFGLVAYTATVIAAMIAMFDDDSGRGDRKEKKKGPVFWQGRYRLSSQE